MQSVALLPGLAIDGVVVLADAETVRQRAADRYMGDTVRGQLADADLIVLNKIDLATPEQVAAATRWLAEVAQARASSRRGMQPFPLKSSSEAFPNRSSPSTGSRPRIGPRTTRR